MEIRKANWTTDGDSRFRMEVQLSKVDVEQRLVSGWATLDNPDLQDDIVTADASSKAFSRFRGNIREMHQPIAVGRMVSYNQDQYFDPETKQFYNGVFVTARVSKGAQATWEKVLDGTLSAFSIKGPIRKSHMQLSKDGRDKPLRVVEDYDLEELSLVDSGGNQKANVISFTKSVDGEVEATGMAVEASLQGIYWCAEDKIAKCSTESSAVCPEGHTMTNIAWEELDANDATRVDEIITKFTSEGGVDVAETNTNAPAPGTSAPQVTPADEQGRPESEVKASESAGVEEAVVPETPVVEKAADEDVKAQEENSAGIEKALGELEEKVTGGVEKNAEAIASLIKDIDSKFEAQSVLFDDKFAKLAEEQGNLAKSLATVVEGLEKMTKSISGLEDETAMKKSLDLGGSGKDALGKPKGEQVWEGAFL